MKTSDKLLLTAVLTAMGLFGLVHLGLYAKYRKGELVTEKALHAADFTTYHLPQPQYVVVEGRMRTRIVPSDSFFIELRKNDERSREVRLLALPKDKPIYEKGMNPEGDVETLTYRMSGDTLIIQGGDPRPWPESFDIPLGLTTMVTLHCRNLPIEIRQGEVVLAGSPLAGADHRLSVRNGRVVIGELIRPTDGREFFDTIRMQAYRSKVTLNPAAIVTSLQAQIQDHSLLEDHQTTLGGLLLCIDSSSRASLTGPNLEKLRGKP